MVSLGGGRGSSGGGGGGLAAATLAAELELLPLGVRGSLLGEVSRPLG